MSVSKFQGQRLALLAGENINYSRRNNIRIEDLPRCMDDTEADTMMVIAGVALSLLTLIEIYSSWKNARGDRTA